jgi:hypothetical protein
MRKLSEYKDHAQECRRLATQMQNPAHKTQLQEMAQTWEMLAAEREKQLKRRQSRRRHDDVFSPF